MAYKLYATNATLMIYFLLQAAIIESIDRIFAESFEIIETYFLPNVRQMYFKECDNIK